MNQHPAKPRAPATATARMVAGVAIIIVLAATTLPSAQASDRTNHQPNWNVHLSLGPYKPRISATRLQRSFYDLMFAPDTKDGDGSLFKNRPLMKMIEVDWYAARPFGVLGIVGRFGHWRTTGSTRNCSDAAGDFATCNSTTVFASAAGADQAALTVVPLSLGGLYKLDYLYRRWGIPLTLHARLAADYHLWWASAGGKTSKRNGRKGNGGVVGVEAAAGADLALAWLDPSTARRSRATSSITDSYLTFEATRMQAGFDEERLDFSDTVFSLGLALEFQ